MNASQKGFTLVELIVTIAILTLLAGVLVPSVNSYMDKGKKGKAAADMREMTNIFNQYKADLGVWPHPTNSATVKTEKWDLVGMAGFYKNVLNKTAWEGPYVSEGVMTADGMVLSTWVDGAGEGFLDPWDRPYSVYCFADGYEGTAGAIVLVSTGANGTVDTADKDILAGKVTGDDLVRVVSYNLR